MAKTSSSKPTVVSVKSDPKTKNQQVIDLLSRESGATLDEMSTLARWLPHSTRSFMTGCKKKGHMIESYKIDRARRYRIVPRGAA